MKRFDVRYGWLLVLLLGLGGIAAMAQTQELDFGDAPSPYPTLLNDNGARHGILSRFYLGSKIDSEKDGQPEASAKGDDQTPAGTVSDEDGVLFLTPLTPGATATIQITTTMASTQTGRLCGWIDFDQSGSWNYAEEQVFNNVAVTSGSQVLSIVVPSTAKAGATFARFRLTQQGLKTFDGPASDGEVEDYQVSIQSVQSDSLDFGDAPDPTYPTTLKNNGARHQIIQRFYLGGSADAESDGQPDASATGDDKTPAGAVDDEDGVVFATSLVPGKSATIQVTTTMASTLAGKLNVWIDFDGNGSWAETPDYIINNLTVTNGLNMITFFVPENAKEGATFARFRLSRDGLKTYLGPAPDGEVEDYQVSIKSEAWDFGDAPDPTYPTTLKNDGARHQIVQRYCLGQSVDAESDGQPDAAATGDDKTPAGAVDDEDGVVFATSLIPGKSATIQVTTTMASTLAGKLNAWIDFDGNGSWAETPDYIINNLTVTNGLNTITFFVPENAKEGATFARFRLSREGLKTYFGPAPDGEVEDYQVSIKSEAWDFGDAPDPTYPTTLKNDGARHQIVQQFWLGQSVDPESDGQPDATATGDDKNPAGAANDENGVVFDSALIPGKNATIRVTTTIASSATVVGFGKLNAWIDFDGNGSWAETPDYVINNLTVTNGLNTITFFVPENAKEGATFARFRLSREGLKTYFGPAPDGEVEDYQVSIKSEAWDFGDAPDPTYPTTLKNDGARHQILQRFYLGEIADPEQDGQPDATATGDDKNPAGAGDDEDGVVFATSLVPGKSAIIQVTTTMANNAAGKLNAWIDFDGNGSWAETPDYVINNLTVTNGLNTITFFVPENAKEGATFARFRLSREGLKTYFGPAPDGEVEDYQVSIKSEAWDFGDAPDPTYPTTLKNNGARHQIVQRFYLGEIADPEQDGQPDATATGDDKNPAGAGDDEDGVVFASPLMPGMSATIRVTTTMANSLTGKLNAWIDFDGNGSWAEAGDYIINNLTVTNGLNTITIVVPENAKEGATFARFRLSREGLKTYFGLAPDGEVEDYQVSIVNRPNGCQGSCRSSEFWLAFPGNYAPDPANPVNLSLCVAGNPGVIVVVEIPGLSFTNTVAIPAAGLISIDLPKAADLGDANDKIEAKGIHVMATESVSIHALSYLRYTTEGYLALGTDSLGTEYIVAGYANVHTNAPDLNGTQFALVASEPGTVVTIWPSFKAASHPAGVPYNIHLNQGETYQLRSTEPAPADLTGTIVSANKPIALFGSHRCANVASSNYFFANYLVEQLTPVGNWGLDFFTYPLATRSGDTFRVMAAKDNTKISLNGAFIATINRGKFHQLALNAPARIQADQPVFVTQFSQSADTDGVTNADPFMVIVSHTGMYLPNQAICTPAPVIGSPIIPIGGVKSAVEIFKKLAFPTNYLNIIAPVGAVGSVQLDGVALPAAAFGPIPGGLYAGAQVKVSTGLHRVTSPDPVSVIGYGWGEYDAYGWPACFALGDATPPVVTAPPDFTVVATPSTAAGTQGCTATVPDLRGKVTFVDNCELSPNSVVRQNPPPGTQVGLGPHSIEFSISDAAGNTGYGETIMMVIGGGQPTLVVPTNITVNAQGPAGVRVSFEAYALRSCGDKTPLVCDPPSNSLFPPGRTTVKCRLDDPEFPLTATFDVVVVYSSQIKLGFTRSGKELLLEWDAADATLQRADNILGPWTDVKATNSYRVSTSATTREYYRLKQ